jgi:hypothetical protein
MRKIGDQVYEMQLFEAEELETYLDALTFKVSCKEKKLFTKNISRLTPM